MARVSLSKAQVFRDSMSVALPVGTYGIAFGAAAVANGFSVIFNITFLRRITVCSCRRHGRWRECVECDHYGIPTWIS